MPTKINDVIVSSLIPSKAEHLLPMRTALLFTWMLLMD